MIVLVYGEVSMTRSETYSNPWSAFFDEAAEIIAKAASVDTETIRRFMEIPPDSKLGDIATTISFHLAKKHKKNPAQIASEIVEKLTTPIGESALIEKVDSKGPYINLFYNRTVYVERTITSASKMADEYGQSQEFSGERALIEFPAVNPSKPWHIGHTRNSVLGDTLGNILKAVGYDVIKLDYINDLGLQIAQLTWKLMQIEDQSDDTKYDHYLGHLYVGVQEAFENDKKTEEEIREIARQL